MPHSSGGGSHGGGSHSGSHGGGGGGSTSHSSTYFAGAHHYAYYKNGRVHHFYNKDAITPATIERNRNNFNRARKIWAVIYGIILLLMTFSCLFEHASRATTSYNDRTIIIDDQLSLIKDSDALMAVLEDFQEKSNVTPYILTIPNEEWQEHYSSLETYAYDIYLNLFEDEMHWLIVYSEDGADWNDWSWEGMQGDDTDPVLTTYNTDRFTKSLHKHISEPQNSLDDALISSFTELNNEMYKTHANIGGLLFGIFGLAIYAGFVYLIIWGVWGQYLDKDAVAFELPDPEKKYLEDTCQYCGGMFIHGIHITCPHCAAPLPPADGLVYVFEPKKLS